MIILGIDPGTARTGYGVIERTNGKDLRCVTYGCIETPKEEAPHKRLWMLEKGLKKVFRDNEPAVVAVEKLYFFKNLTTALPVSEARGVVLLEIAKRGLVLHEFTPLQVKMTIGGYGRADKKQIQRMVKEILKLDSIPKPDDAADGLSMAIAASFIKG